MTEKQQKFLNDLMACESPKSYERVKAAAVIIAADIQAEAIGKLANAVDKHAQALAGRLP